MASQECLPKSKSALKETAENLRKQAAMPRKKVSYAATEIKNYCLENAKNDHLLQGFSQHSNPYKEGKGCPVM